MNTETNTKVSEMNTEMNGSERFFYDNAEFSWDPRIETREEGRRSAAKALAKAEQWATEKAVMFKWDIDRDSDSSDFSGERPAWVLWECCAYLTDENIPDAGVRGVDFGRDGSPRGSAYARVIRASLALDMMVGLGN